MFADSGKFIRSVVGATLTPVIVLTSCGGDDSSPGPEYADAPATIAVTSTAFGEGDAIPERYTCDGDEVSPPLAWTGVPEDSAALALVVDDPDASSGTFTHWVVLDVPVTTTSSDAGGVPEGGVQATSSAGDAAYAGPCPPSGTHHYRFTVVALDAECGLTEGATLDDALAAVDEHAIARGTLTGTYSRG
jgi:Raf kinase inhibitor-like YbhB/YbcL family protein